MTSDISVITLPLFTAELGHENPLVVRKNLVRRQDRQSSSVSMVVVSDTCIVEKPGRTSIQAEFRLVGDT
jgi:hypothetical protein